MIIPTFDINKSNSTYNVCQFKVVILLNALIGSRSLPGCSFSFVQYKMLLILWQTLSPEIVIFSLGHQTLPFEIDRILKIYFF